VNADVLLDRIEFADGVVVGSSQFVYPTEVSHMQYSGPIDRFRRQDGAQASARPDGDPPTSTTSTATEAACSPQEDLGQLFSDQMEVVWGNNNLDDRILLQSQSGYSFVVGLRTRVWDRASAPMRGPSSSCSRTRETA
jgi:hypothetical protein